MFVAILLISLFIFEDSVFATTKNSSVASVEIANKQTPQEFIKSLGDEALRIINQPKINKKQVALEFKNLVENYFAIGSIAKFSLGLRYRQLKNEEKTSFLKSFTNMMIELYSSEFSKYKEAKFQVISVVVKTPERHFIVKSNILINNNKINVSWSVFNVDGKLKIFDVIIDDISLSQIQRADIDGKISQSGIKKFLEVFTADYKDI